MAAICFRGLMTARVVVYAYNPSTQRKEDHEFKASVGFVAALCPKITKILELK